MAQWRKWLLTQPPVDEELLEKIALGEDPESIECQCMYLEEQHVFAVRAAVLKEERRREGVTLEHVRAEERAQRAFEARDGHQRRLEAQTRREIEKQSDRLTARGRIQTSYAKRAADRWALTRRVWEGQNEVAERRAMFTEALEGDWAAARRRVLARGAHVVAARDPVSGRLADAARTDVAVTAAIEAERVAAERAAEAVSLAGDAEELVERAADDLASAARAAAAARAHRDQMKKGRKLKEAEATLLEFENARGEKEAEHRRAGARSAEAAEAAAALGARRDALEALIPLAQDAARDAQDALALAVTEAVVAVVDGKVSEADEAYRSCKYHKGLYQNKVARGLALLRRRQTARARRVADAEALSAARLVDDARRYFTAYVAPPPPKIIPPPPYLEVGALVRGRFLVFRAEARATSDAKDAERWRAVLSKDRRRREAGRKAHAVARATEWRDRWALIRLRAFQKHLKSKTRRERKRAAEAVADAHAAAVLAGRAYIRASGALEEAFARETSSLKDALAHHVASLRVRPKLKNVAKLLRSKLVVEAPAPPLSFFLAGCAPAPAPYGCWGAPGPAPWWWCFGAPAPAPWGCWGAPGPAPWRGAARKGVWTGRIDV